MTSERLQVIRNCRVTNLMRINLDCSHPCFR
jgi:hypothetical protein